MRHLIIYIASLFLFLAQNIDAGEEMKSISTHDGLGGESVYSIFKSHWDVMWVGTSNGISSYDGYQVKTYRVGEQRSKNAVWDIAQSRDGFIWAATVSGVYKVDGSKPWMTRVMTDVSCKVSSIKIINDRVYFGGDDGLYIGDIKKDSRSFKHVYLSKNHMKGSDNVNDIIVDGNLLWVLCNYDLYQYDLATGKVRDMRLRGKLMLNNPLRKIAKSGDRIFIGTFNNGLFVFDIKTGVVSPYVDVNCRVITCLSVDGKYLYVGTDGSGLHLISLATNNIVRTYSTSPDSRFQLKDNTVYAFYHDPSGVNFFGYYRQGLQHNYFKKCLFKAYHIPELFDSYGKNIRSICIDGKIKVLGSRGGLWYIDEAKHFVKFFSPEELGGSIVTNVVKYAGQYYCCTFNGGVMRIDPKTLTTSRFGTSDALRNTSFGCLKVSPKNELWMSGNAGVYIYNAFTDTERHFDYRNSQLPDTYCNNIFFDRQERCWISSAKGISLYDPIDNTVHDNGFPDGFFNMQHEASGTIGDDDNLVFWSADGLFRTNEEMTKFEQIKTDSPIGTQFVSQVIYDKRHKSYWISTESGMFRCNNMLNEFRKFSDESGLDTHEFSNTAITISEDNILWTGTMHGLYYCNLDEAARFSIGKARIMLDELWFGAVAATDAQVVSVVRDRTVKLLYNFGAQTFAFTPVLLNYCNQEELCFEYRFNNEGEWIQQKGHEQIDVSGLPLGQTTMQIRIAGNKDYTEYRFYVMPSVWFYFEIIAMIIFIVVIALLYRQRLLVQRQQAEMARVQKELEESKRKYSRINTNEDEQQRMLRRLEEYMRSEKPYLNNDLKLSDVASRLDVSTVKLSQLFSMYVQKNYYDYINQWRLDEFKERLNDKRYSNYTLLALAEECGFKRSSFFSTFKKVEGTTPTEYVKKVKG